MKKILLLLLSSFIILTSSDVSFASFSENADKKEGYDGNIIAESNNTTFDKYILQENGVENELIVDKIRNVYVFNGREFSQVEYNDALLEQIEDINNGVNKSLDNYLFNGKLSKINYEVLEETKNTADFSICTYANCNPNEVPTTGYGTMRYVGVMNDYDILVATTSGALAVFASIFLGGNVTLAHIICAGAVEFFASYGVSKLVADVDKATYQAIHTSCPATKEEKRFTITETVPSGDIVKYKEKTVSYFYHSKPW